MTAGSVLGTLAVLGWSEVGSTAQLYGVFVLLRTRILDGAVRTGVRGGGRGDRPGAANGALLTVTLVAGLASSIFIPLTGWLADAYGWRGALRVVAVVRAALAIPLHLVSLRRTAPAVAGPQHGDRGAVARVLRDRGFWLLAAGFVLHSGALAVVAVHLVLYLTRAGHRPALAARCRSARPAAVDRPDTDLGASPVVADGIDRGDDLHSAGVALAMLPLVGDTVPGAAACIVMVGIGFGVAAIAIPALLLERHGRGPLRGRSRAPWRHR